MKLDLSKILNTILWGDVLEKLRLLPDNCIDCIITSPPYYMLRNYGFDGQWGLETTPEKYLDNLFAFMRECKRVIKPTGTIWINLGDSYGTVSGNQKQGNAGWNKIKYTGAIENYSKPAGSSKCLMLLPHRFAIRCVDELGLILRNDIIWAAPNKMPESVTDRFSKKHEFIFFFTKSQKYFFDLDGIRDKCPPLDRWGVNKLKANGKSAWDEGTGQSSYRDREMQPNGGMKNPGDVADFWDINTKPSSHNHYASYNSELIDKPIIAGCPEFVCTKCGKPREKIIKSEFKGDNNKKATFYQRDGKVAGQSGIPVESNNREFIGYTDCKCGAEFAPGIVLDPFCGTGTTLKRAKQLSRNVIGIEGKKEYVDLANKIFSTVENRLF